MKFYVGIETRGGGVRTSAPLSSFETIRSLEEYVEELLETYPWGSIFIRPY